MSKTKLFTHTDLDGVGCAILAYLAFGRENVDVEYCDYGNIDEKVTTFINDPGYSDYDKIFITDISQYQSIQQRLLTSCIVLIINGLY